MSPFLPTLVTVTLVEIGSTNAQFSASLRSRGAETTSILRALGFITAGVMALVVAGGWALAATEHMNTRVVTLLLGMSLIWASIGQFRIIKPVAEVEGQDSNIIALRGFARLALTGSAGFLVFAIGVYSGAGIDAFIGAALGGWMGVMVTNLPPVVLNRHQTRKLHVAGLRTVAGIVLAVAGFLYALTALRLI